MNIKKGDIVGRISYGKDILFMVYYVSNLAFNLSREVQENRE